MSLIIILLIVVLALRSYSGALVHCDLYNSGIFGEHLCSEDCPEERC